MTRFVEWLAADLYRRGTRFAFGVPGGGVSLDLLDAVQTNGMRSVITAREDAAAIMAGVAGRLARRPGPRVFDQRPGARLRDERAGLGALGSDADPDGGGKL